MPRPLTGTSRIDAIAAEFGRQASAIASAPAFHAPDVLERLTRAVGPSPAGRVLDLACGPGIVAEAVAPLAEALVGVDAAPPMIELAAARCAAAGQSNCAFQVASAERLPFRAAAFDLVITRLTIHHFERPAEALAEVRRVLRPGGRLVVADVVSAPDAADAALHNALERLRDPTHVRMLPAAELTALVSAAGFETVHHESWQQPREFPEWAAVVAAPDRTPPLEAVMRALARGGCSAGIDLEEVEGRLRFRHTWQLLVARRGMVRYPA